MDKVIEDLEIAVDRLGTTRKPDQISNGLRWPSSHVYASMKVPTAKYHTELNLPDAGKLLEKAYKAAERVMNESGYTLYSTGELRY